MNCVGCMWYVWRKYIYWWVIVDCLSFAYSPLCRCFFSAVGHVPNSIALYFILFSTKYFEHVRPLRLNCKPNHHKCIENVTPVREAGGYKLRKRERERDQAGQANGIHVTATPIRLQRSEKYYLMLIIDSKY